MISRRDYRDMGRISVVGVPNSAGSYAAGQEQAPDALRAVELIDALVAAGLEVHDDGDLPKQAWKPDRANPYAQSIEQVETCLKDLTNRLSPLLSAGDTVLVLGRQLHDRTCRHGWAPTTRRGHARVALCRPAFRPEHPGEHDGRGTRLDGPGAWAFTSRLCGQPG